MPNPLKGCWLDSLYLFVDAVNATGFVVGGGVMSGDLNKAGCGGGGLGVLLIEMVES